MGAVSVMNIMTVVFLALIGASAFYGYQKGLIRELSGILSILAASLLVSAFLPTVTALIRDRTPVSGFIQRQCYHVINSLTGAEFPAGDTELIPGGSYDREEIRALMDRYDLDGSRLDSMTDDMMDEFVNGDLKDYLEQIGAEELPKAGNRRNPAAAAGLSGMSKNEQTRMIRSLPVPETVKRVILSYNNSQGYRKLGAANFGDYLAGLAASLILNIIAFVVTFLAVQVIVRLILRGLNLFAHLPLVDTVNRFGGLAAGLLKGIFAVWVLFLVISMLSGTKAGVTLMKMIDDSILLRPLYQHNLFLKIITGAVEKVFS